MDAAAHRAPRAWAELPADTVAEVARRLHDPADFVRFHAVCRPWRNAAPSRSATTTTHLLPWLVAPCGLFSSGLRLRTPFSKSSKRKNLYLAHLPALRSRRFASSDAAGGRLLAAGLYDDDATASLVDPLTGDAVALPELPKNVARGPHRTRGLVSADGSVLCYVMQLGRPVAAVVRPGETDWESVYVPCPEEMSNREFMLMDEHDRRAVALCSSGVLAGGERAMANLPPMPRHEGGDRYVVESLHGELLCVDVLDLDPRLRQRAWVTVHELELDGVDRKPRWVERGRGDGGLQQVCLFLGWESSFAVDSRQFSGSAADVAGGCAFFVGRHPKWVEGKKVYAVYRCSFRDGTATVVDELPEFFDGMSMWYTPRPRISLLSSRRVQ